MYRTSVHVQHHTLAPTKEGTVSVELWHHGNEIARVTLEGIEGRLQRWKNIASRSGVPPPRWREVALALRRLSLKCTLSGWPSAHVATTTLNSEAQH